MISFFVQRMLVYFLLTQRVLCFLCVTNEGAVLRRDCPLFITRSSPNEFNFDVPHHDAIRLNKVLKATHSRREADRMIRAGRVTVNDETTTGCMVVPYKDVVRLDGKIVSGWEDMNAVVSTTKQHNSLLVGQNFEYVKYWKPRGIVCTTDRRIKDNIIDEIVRTGGYRPQHRVFPVGRLDKETSGLILLTSDGRLPNSSLRTSQKQSKVYRVRVNGRLSNSALGRLQKGIVITTVAQRDGHSKPLTAKTEPCGVERIAPNVCEMTLQEGRNRQIRKMMSAIGYEVVELHRFRFGDVSLEGLKREGDWKRLDAQDMMWVEKVLEGAQSN